MKLFIIGNGFDLAHKIESTYWHFEGNLPECGSETESCGLQVAQERLDELDYDPMSNEGMRQWVNKKLAFQRSVTRCLEIMD